MKHPRVGSMAKGTAGYLGVGRFRRTGLKTVRCTVCGWNGSHNGLARSSHLRACIKREKAQRVQPFRFPTPSVIEDGGPS